MINHLTYTYENDEKLSASLSSNDTQIFSNSAQSVLVQIYTAEFDKSLLNDITKIIQKNLPKAIIIGSTTVGEIANGRMLTGEIIIGIDFFTSSTLKPIGLACPSNDEYNFGKTLGKEILSYDDIVGVLLLATPLSIDVAKVLNGITSIGNNYPIFGGGAGDYASMDTSFVFYNGQYFSHGAVAIVFSSLHLEIESKTYLGWQPLSKEMVITEVDGMIVKTVDNKPAFEVYKRYLNIPNDDDFFLNALEFPFLLERDSEVLARVPVSVRNNGELVFVADIKQGEKFRIGYGNPELIIQDASNIHDIMSSFSPQLILLYSCGCRRFLMQNDVELETLPFESFAPTMGFYTYGEFFGTTSNISLLNSTMVVVGMKEDNEKLIKKTTDLNESITDEKIDPYRNKHTRVVSRLLTFITAVTNELEESNREITKLSQIDKLTQIYNRIKLDYELSEKILLAERHQINFSVILIDIDYFKQVNDVHGHLIGDQVLIKIASTLKSSIRETDILGRWGGEEFLIIIPKSDLKDTLKFAEKLRKDIEGVVHPVVGKKTGSFGVSSYTQSDTIETLLDRADKALYKAKDKGRNRVEK